MKRLKIEIPASMVCIGLLLGSGSFSSDITKMVITVGSVAALAFFSFLMVIDIEKIWVDSFMEIRKKLIEEKKMTNERNQKIYEDILKYYQMEYELLSAFVKEFNDANVKNADKFTSIVEQTGNEHNEELCKMRSEISGFLLDYKETLGIVTDSTNALKAIVRTSLESLKTDMRDQTAGIFDGLEDCSDALNDGMDKYIKQQRSMNNRQTEELKDCISSMGEIIAEQVGKVMKANEDLLTYTKQIQEEWTTLNRDEITFLSRVWDES